MQVGQNVVTQLQPEIDKRWSFGTITKKLNKRSYIVQVKDKAYRRSRIHIKPYSGDIVDGGYLSQTQVPDHQPLDWQRVPEFSGFELVEQNQNDNPFVVQPPIREQPPPMEPEEALRRSGRARTQPHHLRDYIVSCFEKGRCFRT